ncbi:MAG TPA: hypothetical protein VIG47_12915 [Gemmatimonadaceae bacterium]|jgi:hypothetical protein
MTGDQQETSLVSRDTDRVFKALGALLARYPESDEVTLRPVMHTVVTEARAVGLYPEMLLRLLKESWNSLPEPATIDARARHYEVRNRVVSLCIREYYRTENAIA